MSNPCAYCSYADDAKTRAELAANRAEERLSEYEQALRYIADYQMTGTEMTLHIDFQGVARAALSGSAEE